MHIKNGKIVLLTLTMLFTIVSQQAFAKDHHPETDITIVETETNIPDHADVTVVETDTNIPDPYEKYNRSVFAFNDMLDTYILSPVATLYNKIMPAPLNRGVHNFYSNINEIPTIINDLLQVNVYQAINDSCRLAMNTTFGILGFFDIATNVLHLEHYSNDFGLTLTNWGYKNSNYFVVPFWGSYTFRDAVSLPVDYYAFSIYPHVKPLRAQYALYAGSVIDRRAQLQQYQEVIDAAAIDKYTFVRDAYLQHRNFQIEQNKHLSYCDKKNK